MKLQKISTFPKTYFKIFTILLENLIKLKFTLIVTTSTKFSKNS